MSKHFLLVLAAAGAIAAGPASAHAKVHLVCAGFWLGALPPLWLIARDREHSILASVAGRSPPGWSRC
jgi:putative copper export protein